MIVMSYTFSAKSFLFLAAIQVTDRFSNPSNGNHDLRVKTQLQETLRCLHKVPKDGKLRFNGLFRFI